MLRSDTRSCCFDEWTELGNGDMSTDIFLGDDENPIPAGTWFPLYLDGEYFTDGPMTGNYDNVPGLAVERTVDSEEGSTVRLMLYGEHEGVTTVNTLKDDLNFGK